MYKINYHPSETVDDKVYYISASDGKLILINNLVLTSFDSEGSKDLNEIKKTEIGTGLKVKNLFEKGREIISEFFNSDDPVSVDGISSATTPVSVSPVKVYPTYPTDSSNPLNTNATIIDVLNPTTSNNLNGPHLTVLNDYWVGQGHAQYPYNYPTNDHHFDDVNVYYHIRNFMPFLWQFGGSNPSLLTVRTNSVCSNQTDNNGCYFPSAHRINFGNGAFHNNGKSSAREAQLIYHEYTHSLFAYRVDPPQNASTGDQIFGINEGISDYFAGAYTGESKIGVYVFPSAIRDMANPKSDRDHMNDFPSIGGSGPHIYGEFFSSVLWEIRNSGYFTNSQFDRAVYNTLSLLPVDADFEDFKETLITARISPFTYMSEAQKAIVIEIFGNKGVGNPIPSPSAPANVQLTNANSSSGSPNITWSNNSSNQYIESYKVWRRKKDLSSGITYSFELVQSVSANSFTDTFKPFPHNTYAYQYRINATNALNESSGFSSYTEWTEDDGSTEPGEYDKKMNESSASPKSYSLNNNYPNPFNPSTTISFDIPEQSEVKIEVYNIMGQLVTTLINEAKPTGSYEVSFDASGLPSGVYIARLTAVGNTMGFFIEEIKMNLVK